MADAAQKVAIVTAASSGIGLGAARALSKRGWALGLMSRSEAVETVADELGAIAVRGDVTDPGSLKTLVQTTVERFGRIDGSVINTGHPPKGRPLDISDDDWHTGMDIVLMPAVRMTRLLAPLFREQGHGAIVAISSFAAREPDLAYPLSSAFRAALGSFLKLCVNAHAGEGWRINAVLPGFMNNYAVVEEAVKRIPARRYGGIDELGATIAFLLSDEAGYINGQQLLVDGGLVSAI